MMYDSTEVIVLDLILQSQKAKFEMAYGYNLIFNIVSKYYRLYKHSGYHNINPIIDFNFLQLYIKYKYYCINL